jgi:hypothetical protein
MWAINAWINHTDCSARNTLDMYVTDGGRSFVRHHLIDFSGCLGSASIASQPIRSGHEYWVDGQTIARSLVTLALPPFAWEHSAAPDLQGLGFIDSRTFDPGAWRPYLANPAFDQRTENDIRWGARIVAGFTDEHIRAAVEQGRYSDPRTTEYLVRILQERRDKIVHRWLAAEAAAPGLAPDSISDTADSARASQSDAELVPLEANDPVPRLGAGGRVKRAMGNFLADGWTIVAAPFRVRGTDLLWVGAALGVETALYLNDQSILDAAVRNREAPVFRSVLETGDALEPVGFMGRTNPYYIAALGTGYALNIRVLRTIPTEILESHLLAGGVRNLLKAAVGRRHPFEHAGPNSFEVGGGTSFPSGHTSVAFELATIASMNAHSLPVTIAAYSLATTVAVQRVESLNHWPSDVFIAALYGTLAARTVVNLHVGRETRRALRVSLLPRISDQGQLAGLQLVRRF